MHIEQLLSERQAIHVAGTRSLEVVLRRLAEAAQRILSYCSVEDLYYRLLDRELQYPTSTPEGVAFPHAMIDGIGQTVPVIARLSPGVDFGSGSRPPVTLVFGLFSPADRPFDHVRVLARLARIARAPGAIDRLKKCDSGVKLFQQMILEDRSYD